VVFGSTKQNVANKSIDKVDFILLVMMAAAGEEDDKNATLLGYCCLFSSLVCLGTWPAFLRLASTVTSDKDQSDCFNTKSKGPQTRRRKQRDIRFVYLDYAFSYLISSWIPLLVETVVSRWNDSNTRSETGFDINNKKVLDLLLWIGFASLGGVLLSIGNLTLQWATTVYKAPLTTIVAIQASLTVLLGTSLNALLEHLSNTPRPTWLFIGILFFLMAIGTATLAHQTYSSLSLTSFTNDISNPEISESTEESSLDDFESEFRNCMSRSIELQASTRSYGSSGHGSTGSCSKIHDDILHDDNDFGMLSVPREQQLSVDTVITIDVNNVSIDKNSSQKALLLAVIGGCCFGFFSPAFNVAVNDPFGFAESDGESLGGGLSVTTANLCFSFAFTISSVMGTMMLLRRPPPSSGLTPGLTVHDDYPKSFSFFSPSCRWGIAAGFLCGVANLLQFRGGQLVGFATADLVQAYPLISTFWDVVLFGEYGKRSCVLSARNNEPTDRIIRTTYFYLAAMYVLYLGGVVCVVLSATNPNR